MLNKTSFSQQSRRSGAFDETPFRNITSEQTLQLLRGDRRIEGAGDGQAEDIEENAEGEDESDGDHGILSKVERRRLNQLNSRPGEATTGVKTSNLVAEEMKELDISAGEDNDDLFN